VHPTLRVVRSHRGEEDLDRALSGTRILPGPAASTGRAQRNGPGYHRRRTPGVALSMTCPAGHPAILASIPNEEIAMNAPARAPSHSAPVVGVLAAVGFLGAYLAVGPVSGAFADRPLPLPGSPASEAAAFYAANPTAVGITAALQIVSVACFAVFVAGLAPALRAVGAAWLPPVGYLSAAAMVVSSALSGTLAVLAPSAGDTTVTVLRMGSFYAGGVTNVVLLGVFVFGSALVLGRERLFGRPTRWFGFVAGTLAMLSVLSLAIYYANLFLPVGRVLSMVWTVVAAVVVLRRVTADARTTR
jgi:hypothetical protein